MDGGAWPFLVGGVICLVNSDNERDSLLLMNTLFSVVDAVIPFNSRRVVRISSDPWCYSRRLL